MPKLKVLSETQTLEAVLAGRSLARYGDGELRLCLGGNAVSQRFNKDIGRELRGIIQGPSKCLVGLPWPHKGSPKKVNWEKYTSGAYGDLFKQRVYGSAFITRPDSAPWIENEDYLKLVQQLWRGKEVTLIAGDRMTSLSPDLLVGAKSVRVVIGPQTQAYSAINEIEEEVGRWKGPILMCLGATATVLAERFARAGLHAVDLGHIGWMVKRRYDWMDRPHRMPVLDVTT
jgi:hypothetical protein